MPQPQLGAASQPQEGAASHPQLGATSQQARRAWSRERKSRIGRRAGAQQGSTSQPQLGAASQPPQAGAGAGAAHPQLGAASQPQAGAQQLRRLCNRLTKPRILPPKRGPQHGSTSHPQLGATSQPQLGATSQPQLGAASQQPRLNKPAFALEPTKLNAIANNAGTTNRRMSISPKSDVKETGWFGLLSGTAGLACMMQFFA